MSRVSFVALMAAVAVLSATAAEAADIYGGSAPPPVQPYGGSAYLPSSPSNWNGAYLGAQGGMAWGSARNKVKGVSTRSADTSGGNVGLYGGVNASVGANFVVGAEADINYSGENGTSVNGGKAYRAGSDWNGTVRGRVGVAFDRIMPYATGGIAFVDNGVRGNGSSSSSTEVGMALGAGVEGKITDRVSAKLEYMYLGTPDGSHNLGKQKVESDQSSNILRLGAAYKF